MDKEYKLSILEDIQISNAKLEQNALMIKHESQKHCAKWRKQKKKYIHLYCEILIKAKP